MLAAKGNKEYTIDESQQKFYQDSGFDIKDENGDIVAYGRGKTVPYDEYMAATKEVERLQKLCTDQQKELGTLKAEKKTAGKKAGE